MKLPRVTLDKFLSFNPCWRNSEKGRRRLRYYARKLGGSANALEILALRRIPAVSPSRKNGHENSGKSGMNL